MAAPASSLQVKILRRAKDSSEYALYKAALEWSLLDPIVIESRDDFKSEYLWRERVEPYHHQVTNLITFCRRLPVTLLADDVGLGKTISAGLIISELISRERVTKILVVCPKLLMPQWQEELQIKFGLRAETLSGKKLITTKLSEETVAVITTYSSARLYLDEIASAGYQMLILDEAHKLRNLYGVDPAPQVATRFRKALEDRMFKYVLMLTATPIHNRLWDIYSLIDLLSVARGHENPFGSEGMFIRKYIADNRTQARRLNPEAEQKFRDIVYGYMSRVRRADAKLYFPERKVLLRAVTPTSDELALIDLIKEPIQKLNRLAQISILQALISSPEALAAQLKTMASHGTVPSSLSAAVGAVVKKMPTTAKLQGLGVLVDKLRAERPEDWRAVVFTGRRETQATIQAFLEARSISCGLINGDSGRRNQETIEKFKKRSPEIRVIISTEAGSEGINLQVANVLVNYDLPWNPMIVEQRIGRIQRLASEYAAVSVFNVILRGTFEEYVVGRLMEKLQLASHAIGDVESLLEAAGSDGDDEEVSFEEKIRRLVVDSLAGKDVAAATRMAEQSITNAKIELENEESTINEMLGGMDDASNRGPQPPKLTPVARSMDVASFVLTALNNLGAHLSQQPSGLYLSELDRQRELIRFENDHVEPETTSTLYAPGTAAFERLVSRFTGVGRHIVRDIDRDAEKAAGEVAKSWVDSFEGVLIATKVEEVARCFDGVALIRIRVTVAHDAYERLVEVTCPADETKNLGRRGLEPAHGTIDDPAMAGVDQDCLIDRALLDTNIAEFCRFYRERLDIERQAAGGDIRKKKKLEDDFTPRLDTTLVGLDGTIHRKLKVAVHYRVDSDAEYESFLTIVPVTGAIERAPIKEQCAQTGKIVPLDCLAKDEISRLRVLRHLLVTSETSGRLALPEHTVICAVTGKRILVDEAEQSAVTGKLVTSTLLMTSAISGQRAEPSLFGRCEFTSANVLKTELNISQVSEKRYRVDEQLRSAVSGKIGHKQEFILCAETNKPLLPSEAEKCEITGKLVMPGLLETCAVSGMRVLPAELETSALTGARALKKYFVTSSVSGARLLEKEAVRSIAGKFCSPLDARSCIWSGKKYHPDDLKICELTGETVYSEYLTTDGIVCVAALASLLNGLTRTMDKRELWPIVTTRLSNALGGKHCEVKAAQMSLHGQHLAVCAEVKSWLGLKVRYAGLLYSISDQAITGKIVQGKREDGKWILEAAGRNRRRPSSASY